MYNTKLYNSFNDGLIYVNTKMYEGEHALAAKHKYIAKGFALTISVINVSSELVKTLALAVDRFASSILNVLGAKFNDSCSLADSARCLRSSFSYVGNLTGKVLSVPLDIIFQTYNVWRSPADVVELSKTLDVFLNPPKKEAAQAQVINEVAQVKNEVAAVLSTPKK
ncbi:MAG: hypothetical protein WCT85_06290 [Parachlamydiales bacterium]